MIDENGNGIPDFIERPEGDSFFPSGGSYWDSLKANWNDFWGSDEGKSIFVTGITNWRLNIAYANAQKYLGLFILGYISYKTFK